MLFENAEYPFVESFCHYRGECNLYTATALDTKQTTMEEVRSHRKEEHPATSPPIDVTTDGKDPARKLTRYQACVPS
jgi:hypothetical protein